MDRMAKLYGFEGAEEFARYLIARAREERLSIVVELSENGFTMSIEPLEHRVYICPYHGETREK